MPRAYLALAVGVVLAASALDAHAKPRTFRLEVTPTSGSVGDSFQVTVTLELDKTSGYDEFQAPKADDFLVKDSQVSRTQSVSYSSAAGRTVTAKEVRRYVLQAKRAGRLTIGPATLLLDGRTHRTDQVAVSVTAGGTARSGGAKHADPTAGGVGVPGFYPPDPSMRSEMFLHAVLDKSEAYLGEQVIITWLLYTQTDVLNFKPTQPRLSNLWAETLYEPNRYLSYHRTKVGRVPYSVAVVSKRALFPTQAGTVEIPPFVAEVTTMHTSLAGPARVSSESRWLRVKPLPPNPPPGFEHTYVGQFEVAAAVDRQRIKAGDAITMTLTVTGAGALRRTTPPRIDVPGFRFRAPRDFDEKVDTSTNVVRGSRTYRYWVSPQRGGALTLPAIGVPYFDPSTGAYRTAKTQPISLYVTGNPVATLGSGGSGAGVATKDMRPAMSLDAVDSVSRRALHGSTWFWLVAFLPMLGFASVVVVDRMRSRERPSRSSRSKKGTVRARKRLRKATALANDGKEPELYAELARLIHDLMAARTGSSGRGMRRDELIQHLGDAGYSAALCTDVAGALDRFDAARFSPVSATPDDMRDAVEHTRELLRRLENPDGDRAGPEMTA